MYDKNILQGTDKVERIVRQLAQANENLTGNVLKTILTTRSKNKICMHEVKSSVMQMNKQSNDGRTINSSVKRL